MPHMDIKVHNRLNGNSKIWLESLLWKVTPVIGPRAFDLSGRPLLSAHLSASLMQQRQLWTSFFLASSTWDREEEKDSLGFVPEPSDFSSLQISSLSPRHLFSRSLPRTNINLSKYIKCTFLKILPTLSRNCGTYLYLGTQDTESEGWGRRIVQAILGDLLSTWPATTI